MFNSIFIRSTFEANKEAYFLASQYICIILKGYERKVEMLPDFYKMNRNLTNNINISD